MGVKTPSFFALVTDGHSFPLLLPMEPAKDPTHHRVTCPVAAENCDHHHHSQRECQCGYTPKPKKDITIIIIIIINHKNSHHPSRTDIIIITTKSSVGFGPSCWR